MGDHTRNSGAVVSFFLHFFAIFLDKVGEERKENQIGWINLFSKGLLWRKLMEDLKDGSGTNRVHA